MFRFKFIFLIISTSILFSCDDNGAEPEQESRIEDFNYAWESINSVYPYFELKQIDWTGVYDRYLPRVSQSMGDDFIGLVLEMLGELKDGHVYLETIGGYRIKAYIPPRTLEDYHTFSPLVVRKYFEKDLIITGVNELEYGITSSNIGYINISSFGSHIDFNNDLNAAMNFIRESKGLIIDVRHNTGGDGVNVNKVIGRFLAEPIRGLDTYVLGELIETPLITPGGDFQYLNPVVVIINGVCFSATESFAEIMKQLPQVELIGSTTGGGSAGFYGSDAPASGNFLLSDGILIHVGTIDIRRYDNIPFEWIGIPPDVEVVQTEEDINQGRDVQLEYAISLLN